MKRIVSGIKPSGTLTLGNYIGAIRQFVQLQQTLSDTEFFLFVADMHAITVEQDPAQLKKHIREIAAIYLAAGLDQDKTVLFIQSEIQEHVELGYLLQSLTYMGELERMTQYKDKAKKQETGITSALFTYPVLMAADIILYDADYVPVGEDQKQHLELTRTIAERFNNRYGNTFAVPEVLMSKTGAKIMDLQQPQKKMDKSGDNERGCIFLLEPIDGIKKKILSSVTDSESVIKHNKTKKPGITNLMTIYSALSGLSYAAIEKKYENTGYGVFKTDLAAIITNEIISLQEKYHNIVTSSELDDILDRGRNEARKIAGRKLKDVYNKIGLTR